MQTIFSVAFPVFALVFVGWLGGRLRLLGSDSTAALNAFVSWFALPALLFGLLSRVRLDEVFNLGFACVLGGAIFATMAVGIVLARIATGARWAECVLHGLSAGFGNVGYMGVPLCLAAFGPDGALPATLAMVIGTGLVLSTAIVLIEFDLHSGGGLGETLSKVGLAILRNPMLLAIALGLAFSGLGIGVPEPARRLVDLLGASAAPCALFAIGLFLSDKKLSANLGEVGLATVGKLLFQPLVALALVPFFLDLDTMWGKAAVMLAALPTASNAFILSKQYDLFVDRASAVVFLSTVLSVPTVTAALVLLKVGV